MANVALATRKYGEGQVVIHTDKIGAKRTGHSANPVSFWRSVLGYASSKYPNEWINVALIVNTTIESTDRIEDLIPITVTKLEMADLWIQDLSKYECLYFAGLPDSSDTDVNAKIASFVAAGGGLIIESPDNGGADINVLTGIEDVFCNSADRPTQDLAYWTNAGEIHYMFDIRSDLSFMVTMKQSDFSSNWTILMSDVENIVTTTTTTFAGDALTFGKSATADIGISFFSSMQKGIVHLNPEEDIAGTSSSSSSSKDSSSSSSSSSVDSSSSSSSSPSSSSSSSSDSSGI